MLVRNWMTREVVTVGPGLALVEAAALMARRRIRHLPVIDRDSRLVGIVTRTDVFHGTPLQVNPFSAAGIDLGAATGGQSLSVAHVMSSNLSTTTADSPIECAAALMHDRKIGALPVMRGEELVGLITESDILRAFTEILSAGGTGGARITFDVSKGEDVVPLLAQLTAKHQLQLVSLISLRGSERAYCVVRICGTSIDAMLEELWKSGHRVENVVRS